VGDRWVRVAKAELETYARDALPTRRSVPGVVILPGTRDEVVRVVKLLAHHRVPFVARGAGTGLSGGALANSEAVLITLTRLNKILEIDAANRCAVVEPGVVNARLSEAVAGLGLFYAPDPSSQTACTLGGNVAENAGGPHCLKYGVTANHVLALEVVLPDGSLITMGSGTGEPWGPDLVGLFVGSEGMFGIATKITVRLSPTPQSVRTLLADFNDVTAAGRAVSAIISSGMVPAALEMMDRVCIEVVEASTYAAGYPVDAAAVLLVELDGATEQQVLDEGAAIERLLKEHGARGVRAASDAAERARLWQGRKKAFGALGRMSPDLVVQDAVVPRSSLPDILSEIESIALRFDLRVGNVFHAGDGNLHPNIGFDRNDPSELERVEHASAAIMHACVEAGGSITGEHGVGLDKLHYMTDIFDADTLDSMARLRYVFDPAGIANPGKVIPTHACREWRQATGRDA
jgi:glycolate oxidase subunit GlcD